jgi:hypothetical protein
VTCRLVQCLKRNSAPGHADAAGVLRVGRVADFPFGGRRANRARANRLHWHGAFRTQKVEAFRTQKVEGCAGPPDRPLGRRRGGRRRRCNALDAEEVRRSVRVADSKTPSHRKIIPESDCKPLPVSLQICFLITPTTFGARGTEKGSAHEEATVTKHRRANCRTCHGVSAEHAERRTIAGRRTIQWRRTTRARRAGATEYATRRPRWERPVSVPAQPARPDLRAGSAGTAGPEQARSA